MSKYDKLTEFFEGLRVDRITLTFKEIESALGSELPASAFEHRPWWANRKEGNVPHSNAWQRAGWEVRDVRIDTKRATFVRLLKDSSGNSAVNTPSDVAKISMADAKTALAAYYDVKVENIEIHIRG